MARKNTTQHKRPIDSYQHTREQRLNNPPAGLVTPETDPDAEPRTYAYDPHLDPQLTWAGKAEHTSFEVPTVSLHVHERIDPRTIIQAVRSEPEADQPTQLSLFASPQENPPIRQAIDFYRHKHNWSNRMVAGDSLLVMNSLLEKEGLGGQVQTIYFDPPYGIKYGSNFQPFVNKRDVQDGKDEDLTAEPEQIQAFRDTWELGIHSYLTYLRDRLLLARELLSESGSIFVQISDENVHHVRELMDEVFGASNFIGLVPFRKKTMPLGTTFLEQMADFLIWYAKQKYDSNHRPVAKYHRLFSAKSAEGDFHYCWYEMPDGSRYRMSRHQLYNHALLPSRARVYRLKSLEPSGPMPSGRYDYNFEGTIYKPPQNGWGTPVEGMDRLVKANRIQTEGNRLTYIMYADESSDTQLTAPWTDTVGADDKAYVVQTNTEVIRRCLVMSTDPGDLVLDITCGSGTAAYVAEQWGRRWITCDTSRVAITLAKQRLMTAVFDYYELARPHEGVSSGFAYQTTPHITLGSIANNPDIHEGMTRKEIAAAIARHAPQETLYDQPQVDRKITRVTGPFTVEAVPAPVVKSVDDILLTAADGGEVADLSIARSGETYRQAEWRDELLRTGIRGKAGQYIRFARLEPLPGCRWLHADGETRPSEEGADSVREDAPAYIPMRVVVSFGPEHAPLEQRQVDSALAEAQTLIPKPKLLVFGAFQFDPEAAKDIDETRWSGVTLLKAQMNADLLTDDLKKKRASNESFWLIGQPDVQVERITSGQDKGKYQVSVHGFDYYNTKTGDIESGSADQIAVWLLDTDYDRRSLYPRQVFFPMAGRRDGWDRLARNLKAEIDPELIEAYRGTVSLPFAAGPHKCIAVKIVDDRGIESLRVVELA